MRIPSRLAILVIAASVALPTLALAKEHDRGRGNSGKHSSRSYSSRGERHGGGARENRSFSRSNRSERNLARVSDSRERSGSRERSFSRRSEAPRERWSSRPNVSRERTLARNFEAPRHWSSRPSNSSERTWRRGGDSRERVTRTRSERTYRSPNAGRIERGDRDIVRRLARGDNDRQWRDGGSSRGSRVYRDGRPSRDSRVYRDGRSSRGSRSYAYRDGGSPRYKPSGPVIRRGGGSGGGYYTRHYYTNDFYRPSYVARSGFWLGLSIGTYPMHGYRYWDPYCGIHFSSLVPYYTHCHGHSHPSAIVIVDYRSQAPIATCVYDDGAWVVDDCAHDGYAYEDEYDDDGEIYYEEY